MAEKLAALTQRELEEETRRLASYLSICARQPVEIKILGFPGFLAFTHSTEDDGKKHVIPVVLNPLAIAKIRNKKRALRIWRGMGAHEVLHHLFPAGKFYEMSYAQGFGYLMNLIDDEHIERNGRALFPEWGEWFQSMAPLAFPKKQALYGDGSEILADSFGQNSSDDKPGGSLADKIYKLRFNQFGYYLRRHNNDPEAPQDKAVADALTLIPNGFKDLSKEQVFEIVRSVHETLCQGIDKPTESRQFTQKPQKPGREEGEEEDADELEAQGADGKEGKFGPLKPMDPGQHKPLDGKPEDEPKEEGKPKEGEPKEGEPKEGDPKDAKPEDGDNKNADDKDAKKHDGEVKEGDKKDEKKKNSKKNEERSWDPRKLLRSKWLYVALAALTALWFSAFATTTGLPFWLKLATWIGEAALFMFALAFLFWGGARAFMAWAKLKKKGVLDDIRRFFMRKSVKRVLYPLLGLLGMLVAYFAYQHWGALSASFWFTLLGYFVLMRIVHKRSVKKIGGVAPSKAAIRNLSIAASVVGCLGIISLAIMFATTLSGWFWSTAMVLVWLLSLTTMATGILQLAYGAPATGGGGGGLISWIFGLLRLAVSKVGNAIRHPLTFLKNACSLLKQAGILLWKVINVKAERAKAWLQSKGWIGKVVLKIVALPLWFLLGLCLLAVKAGKGLWRFTRFLGRMGYQGLAFVFGGGGFILYRLWWGLSLALRFVMKWLGRAWFYGGPYLKSLWRKLWFRLTVFGALAAAIMMMIWSVLDWAARVNIWLMIAIIVITLLLLLLGLWKRKKIAKWIMKELKMPLQALMKQFMQAGLDMTTDWFVPIHNIKPVFADEAWLKKNMPEIMALAKQLRPLFAACGQGSFDREDQPDGYDLIDEVEMALLGETSIFVDDDSAPATSLDIQVMLDCSGSMGMATRSLGPGQKHELGKLWAAAVEQAVYGLPGVSAHFWGFKGNVILDCGVPGQRRISGLRHGGGNNDSAMLFHAGQLSAKSGAHMKILLMLSDGMPADCSWLSLRNLVRRFEQDGMIPWNIGLDVIDIRAFRFFTDLVGQSKQEAIATMRRTLTTLVAERL